jgi:hypothetical protein
VDGTLRGTISVSGGRGEIEDLPEGDYDLVVDGTTRGTITVAFNPDKPARREHHSGRASGLPLVSRHVSPGTLAVR